MREKSELSEPRHLKSNDSENTLIAFFWYMKQQKRKISKQE
jgi:hypothetical protein